MIKVTNLIRERGPWSSFYTILPKKLVSGKSAWCSRIYRRQIIQINLMTNKLDIYFEYGSLFDMLKDMDSDY